MPAPDLPEQGKVGGRLSLRAYHLAAATTRWWEPSYIGGIRVGAVDPDRQVPATRKRRRRSRISREREAFRDHDPITVCCPGCHKRMAELWPRDPDEFPGPLSYDGFWEAEGIVKTPYHHSGADGLESRPMPWPERKGMIKDIGNEDWEEVTCGRCGHVWRGRDSAIAAALVQARALKVLRIDLPPRGRRVRRSEVTWPPQDNALLAEAELAKRYSRRW